MSLQINKDPNGPKIISEIWSDTHALGFDMPSDSQACSLLRVLAASKPSAQLLELGSGTGLSTAWILNGMDATSHLTTIDNDPILLSVLKRHLGHDPRLSVVCADADEWLNTLAPATFDLARSNSKCNTSHERIVAWQNNINISVWGREV